MSRRLVLLVTTLGLLLTAAVASAPAVFGGGGCHGKEGDVAPRADTAPAAVLAVADLVVDLENCDFAPLVTNVPVGATVAFVNNDATPHQVTGYQSTWSSAILEQGQAYAWQFDDAGIHPYSCPLHPGMVGAIVVGGSGATTASTESAELVASTAAATGRIEPLAAVAIGAASAIAVLLIGGALARRRSAREHLPA
jgi:plastocyanin